MRWMLGIVLGLGVGCATRDACPPGDLVLPGPRPAFALMRQGADYSSSAIALLAADGTVLAPDFIDSGTAVSTLVTSLSGDAVLPSTPLGTGIVGWLDRGVDLVVLAPGDGTVASVDTRAALDGGRPMWPYDALRLSDDRMLVARYGVDPTTSTDLGRGNDVVVVDHGTMTQRIDLAADAQVDGHGTAYARPSVLLRFGADVLVVLDRLTLDAMHGASGALSVIDGETLAPSAPVVLGALQNCYYASHDPRGDGAWVLCLGVRQDGELGRAAHAGLVHVVPDGAGSALVTDTVLADPAQVPSNGIVALAPDRALYVVSGVVGGAVDRLVEVRRTGETRVVYSATGAFVLGEGVAVDDGRGALVPDASSGHLLRIDARGPEAHVASEITIDDCVDLPPRMIRPLDF